MAPVGRATAVLALITLLLLLFPGIALAIPLGPPAPAISAGDDSIRPIPAPASGPYQGIPPWARPYILAPIDRIAASGGTGAGSSGSAAPSSRAVNFANNTEATDDACGVSENEPSMAVYGLTVLVGSNDMDCTSTYTAGLARSTDGGDTFGVNTAMNDNVRSMEGDPVLLANETGVFYYIWLSFGGDSDIHFSKSINDGVAWSALKKVNDDIIGTFQDRCWAATKGSKIYVTYSEFGSDVDMRMVASLDGGNTWGASKRMNDNVPAGSRNGASLDIDDAGVVHVAWGIDDRVSGGAPYGIFYTNTSDDGQTFTANKQAASPSFIFINGPKRNSLPSIAVNGDGQHLFIGYTDVVGGNMDVYVTASSDGGTTWGAPKKVNDDAGAAWQALPWIDVDPSGIVHMAWADTRNGGNQDTYYSYSLDNGATWAANVKVTTAAAAPAGFIGDFLDIDVATDINIVWTDARNGNTDIWYAHAPFLPSLLSPAVTPKDGTSATDFAYSVQYKNSKGVGPSASAVVIDGVSHPMTTSDTNFVLGATYRYTTKLPLGSHTYRFEFADGATPVRSPNVGNHVGPVVNDPPILENPSLVPATGRTDEVLFTFNISYRDPDGDTPSATQVVISNKSWAMAPAGPPDFLNGTPYTYTTGLQPGSYSHHFFFNDSRHEIRFPATGELPGPLVLPPNLPPVIGDPVFTPAQGNRSTLFTFSALYTDKENVAPTKATITIDGIETTLVSDDTTYEDGANFTFSTRLPLGQDHSFHVAFADDKFSVENPVGSDLPGPIVYNERPRAFIVSPDVPELTVYDTIVLRSASVDFDGDPLNESWESNVDGKLGAGRELHLHLTNATHLLTLYIDDGLGGRNQTSVVLNIRQPFPVLEIGVIDATPPKPIEQDEVVLAGTAANTGDGNATDVNVTWRINGKLLTKKVEPAIPAFTKYASNTSWTPENPGIYTITFEVGTVSVDKLISIAANLPPLVDAGPDVNVTLGKLGAPVTFNGSNASDPDGLVVEYEWDLGDGNTSTSLVPEHTYTAAGTYTVTLKVTDNKGASTRDSLTIVVLPIPKKKVPPITSSLNGLLLLLLLLAIVAVVAAAFLVKRSQQKKTDARFGTVAAPILLSQEYAPGPPIQSPAYAPIQPQQQQQWPSSQGGTPPGGQGQMGPQNPYGQTGPTPGAPTDPYPPSGPMGSPGMQGQPGSPPDDGTQRFRPPQW